MPVLSAFRQLPARVLPEMGLEAAVTATASTHSASTDNSDDFLSIPMADRIARTSKVEWLFHIVSLHGDGRL